MNDRITAGAAAVMGSLVFATGLARWAVTPKNQPGTPAYDPATDPELAAGFDRLRAAIREQQQKGEQA